MRWFGLLMLVLSGGTASAQVSGLERLVDCLEVRSPAFAYESRERAPFQKSDECEPFELYKLNYDFGASCPEEGWRICETSSLLNGEERQACVTEVDAYLQNQLSGILDGGLQQRLERLSDSRNSPFRNRTLQRMSDQLRRGFAQDCSTLGWPNIYGIPNTVFCARVELFWAWSQARLAEQAVQRLEAQK